MKKILIVLAFILGAQPLFVSQVRAESIAPILGIVHPYLPYVVPGVKIAGGIAASAAALMASYKIEEEQRNNTTTFSSAFYNTSTSICCGIIAAMAFKSAEKDFHAIACRTFLQQLFGWPY